MKTQMLRSLVIGLLTVSIYAVSASTAAAQGRGDQNSLVGAWDMTITFRDCTTGAVLRVRPGMISFMSGGTLQEFGTGQQVPRDRTDAHGNWSHDTASNYSAVSRAFRFNPDGSFAGSAKLYRMIELTMRGRSFEATVASEIYDANGLLVARGCATESGLRIE